MSNTRTIARNTGWFGLENIINLIVTLSTSIAIARTLGPSKMGYMVYVSTLAGFASLLGGLGIPQTTRKYMAEFIGLGDRGTARYIYVRAMLLQIALATVSTAGVMIWVLRDASAEYQVAAALLVLSIWPAMVNFISAQANAATEELSRNVPASLVSMLVYLVGIAATVVLQWGVVGVGAATLAMRTTDLLVRLFPAMKRILAWDKAHIQPEGLSRRMMSFAWQSLASLFVSLIVWNRSEVILLKYLNSDIRQVAFYSVAFSMADQLLISSTVFGTAAGATIFAQFGRDKSRLPEIAASSFRYLALTSIPLHFIAAALAVPALRLLYGSKYEGASLVATLAPLLCLPKAFIGPVQNLLESMERQRFVILATALAGVVDISVAWYLIRFLNPALGAVGACIGSGAAQVTAIGVMWAIGIYLYKVKLPWMQVVKVSFISVLAALAAHNISERMAALAAHCIPVWVAPVRGFLYGGTASLIAMRMALLWGILCGGSASVIVLFGLFYLLRVLEPEDRARFNMLSGMLPKAIAGPANAALSLLVRDENANAISRIE
ncbi:MAG: oligosaccharide flippase family protein [Terracidiphilus sp.]